MRGRFAPSPTGVMHLGHAQTMLLCWLQVRASGGVMVMRIEDVDTGRVRPGSEAGILRDLRWLGFDWDEGPDVGGPFGPYRQSERSGLYEASLRRLAGRTFRCTCSRKEVREAAALPGDHVGEVPYIGTCRGRPAHPDRAHALRVRVEPGEVGWTDLVKGPLTEDVSVLCGDFIVRAKSGDHVYQLACVTDDIEMGITDVLRGEDLVDSTGRQLLLYDWLGAAPPRFAHTPLRKDVDGQRLAKSRGSPGLGELRDVGRDPKELLGELAAAVGLLDDAVPCRPDELIEPFADHRSGLLHHA